jgi:hypothetical protein
MNFDPAYLGASLLISGIGYVLFSYGRKQRRMPHTGIGFVMLVYPYFVTNIAAMMGTGALLVGVLWGLVYLGI